MYQQHVIRQLEEKNAACEVDIMLWSNRMDLVAYSNIKGEVCLHRLTWTKVWTLLPPKEGIRVKAMTWRFDGKILAIGYSNDQVLIVNVENKKTLHTISIETGNSAVNGVIECIVWSPNKIYSKADDISESSRRDIDSVSMFLPELPSLSCYSTTIADDKKNVKFFQEQPCLNFVAIGTSDGQIHVSIFGCLPCAVVDLSRYTQGRPVSVAQMHFTRDMNKTVVAYIDREANTVRVMVLDTGIFTTHSQELLEVAVKHERLNALIAYFGDAITVLNEIWDNVLLEIDTHLSNYASKMPQGLLSADFLELLLFGTSTEHMQTFLLHDLTKKGMEKFSQTVETSHANMQKLLMKNVTKVGQHVTYHLEELRGMARFTPRYKILGLDEERITAGIQANGAFLLKSVEMQNIINSSMGNYKASFRWLYSAINDLLDEPITDEFSKMSQQDLNSIAEFLEHFDTIKIDKNQPEGQNGTFKTGFMDRLGQYLDDAPLRIHSNLTDNQWNQFIIHNPCVQSHASIIRPNPEASLVQMYNNLKKTVPMIFEETFQNSIATFRKDTDFLLHTPSTSDEQLMSRNFCCQLTNGSSSNTVHLAFMMKQKPQQRQDSFSFVEMKFGGGAEPMELRQSSSMSIPHGDGAVSILELQFYSSYFLSILAHDGDGSFLCQFPTQFKSADCSNNERLELCEDAVNEMIFHRVHTMPSCRFAVSGDRKLAIILATNKRRVRIYEMEGDLDEEDDEDEDDQEGTIEDPDDLERSNI